MTLVIEFELNYFRAQLEKPCKMNRRSASGNYVPTLI